MEWNKESLIATSGQYWASCTLHTGVQLDIFSAIGDHSLTPEDIANRIETDPRGTHVLLNALAAMNLLDQEEGRFSNTAFSAQYLSKDSPDYSGFIISHHAHLASSWVNLRKAVRNGHPLRTRSTGDIQEEERESFLMGMFNMASGIAPVYAKKIDLSQCQHLLDLGGGPGTYAIHYCLANPSLKATVFDLPTTKRFAEKTIARFNLSQRIQFHPGNFLLPDTLFEQQYDAVWLSHILHGEGPTDAAMVVRKAAGALVPGGKMLIHEFILNDSMDAPLFPALFSLNMLLGTEEGQAYSEGQLSEMMTNSGVSNIRRLPLNSPNGAGILMGEKV